MKRFLIIANKNAVTYKEFFKHIRDNEIGLGYTHPDFDGLKGLCRWITTFPKKMPPMELNAEYSPEKYLKYDHYDAIEVSRTKDIPKDYYQVIGVPITFMDKYCPEQFEIVGALNAHTYIDGDEWKTLKEAQLTAINGRNIYKRMLIRRKQS